MNRFDFFQKHYFFELERRHKITSSLSIPVGVLVVLIGAITYLLNNYQFEQDLYSFAIAFFLLCSIISAIFTIIYLFRSYWSYVYQYLSSPTEYKQYYDELVTYYQENDTEDYERLAKRDFEEALSENYASATDLNWRNNNRKSATLHKANTSLVWLVIFTFISFVIFYIKYLI